MFRLRPYIFLFVVLLGLSGCKLNEADRPLPIAGSVRAEEIIVYRPSPEHTKLLVQYKADLNARERSLEEIQQDYAHLKREKESIAESKAQYESALKEKELVFGEAQAEVKQLSEKIEAIQLDAAREQEILSAARVELNEIRESKEALEIELRRKPQAPTFQVSIQAPKTGFVNEDFEAVIRVEFPLGDGSKEAGSEHSSEIRAVSRYVRATLSANNMEVLTEDDFVLDLNAAGVAEWSYTLVPKLIGEHKLFAQVDQVSHPEAMKPITSLQTNEWIVKVSVSHRPWLTRVYEETPKYALAIIGFFAGILAELIRRKLFGKSEVENTEIS